MSDNFLILIPASPDFVPAEAAQAAALERFKSFVPKADDVIRDSTTEVRFIDAGVNFEKVSCPMCRLKLAERWWQDAMNAAGKRDFADLRITLPCCGKSSTLNDLMYFWAQGFARFSLEAMNPGLRDLKTDQVRDLEKILGCPLRVILAHY
ncbi:MAG TPA: hypothetical protein VJU16_04985 [Planctomycetota bacterium]|nr:hypothetical protein [Planctomycetota bacterium]